MNARIDSMTSLRKLARLSAILVTVLLMSVGADAHTTIKAQASEGVRDDNALRIGHGCEEDHAVVAQSVVFPTDAPVITTSDANVTLSELSEVIAQGSLAGLAQSIQDRSIFAIQDEKVDANGNVIGFHARAGFLRPNLVGRVPFQFSAPSFVAGSPIPSTPAAAPSTAKREPLSGIQRFNLWASRIGGRTLQMSAIAT